MTWLVQYRAASGDVVTVSHDTRDAARDALVDQLFASALQLWQIGLAVRPDRASRQLYMDRGDRFIHHAARLMETTEDSYIIAGAKGRKWLLVEVSGSSPHPSPANEVSQS